MIREILSVATVFALLLPRLAQAESGAQWLVATNETADTEKARKEKKARDDAAEKQKKAHEEEAEKHKKARRDEHDQRRSRGEHERNGHPEQAKPAASKPPAGAAPAPPATAAPGPAAATQSLVVKTFPASNVLKGCAILNGFASDPGKTGKIWFEWGTTPSFGQSSAAAAFNGEKAAGIRICSGVLTKVYFRAVAQSGANFARGDTATFQ